MLLWRYVRNHVDFFRFYICGIKSYRANLLTARCYSIQASSSAMQKTTSKVGRVVYSLIAVLNGCVCTCFPVSLSSFAPNRKLGAKLNQPVVLVRPSATDVINLIVPDRSCAAFRHRSG